MFKRFRPATAGPVAATTPATAAVTPAAAGVSPPVDHAVATEPALDSADSASLIDAARLGSADDVDRLGTVLVERALSGAPDANIPLAAIAQEPTLVLRLNGLVRRRDYCSG